MDEDTRKQNRNGCEVDFDPFAGPVLERLRALHADESLAMKWRAQSDSAIPVVYVRAIAVNVPDAEEVEARLVGFVQNNDSLRTIFGASGSHDIVAQICSPLVEVLERGPDFDFLAQADRIDETDGPLVSVVMSTEKSSSSVVSIAMSPMLGNEIGALDLLRHLVDVDQERATPKVFQNGAAAEELSFEWVLDLGDKSEPSSSRCAVQFQHWQQVDLPLQVLESFASLAENRGASIEAVLERAWKYYLSYLGASEVPEYLTCSPDSAAAFRPNLPVIRTSIVDPDETFGDCALGAKSKVTLLCSEINPVDAVTMTFQPGVLNTGQTRSASGQLPSVVSLPFGSRVHFNIVEAHDSASVSVTFDAAYVTTSTAKLRAAEFAAVLTFLATHPECSLSQMDCLPADERSLVLSYGAGDYLPQRDAASSAEIVLDQAQRNPKAVAIQCDEQEITYGDLRQMVGAYSDWLRQTGLEPGQRVGVMLESSPELVAMLLAVLEIGCAYVPLDKTFPLERSKYICGDSGVVVVVATEEGDAGEIGVPVQAIPDRGSSSVDHVRDTSSHGAYILYTSGSTGKPKGVQISRSAMLAHNLAISDDYELCDSDRVLQFAKPVFDVAVEEIFPTLMNGGCVVLLPDKQQLSIGEFNSFVRANGVTVLNLPASYWHEWVRYLSSRSLLPPEDLRLVIAGSDRVSPEVFAAWQELTGERISFRNGYGPTEAAVTSTLYDPARSPASENTVPIGRPVPNMQSIVVRNGKLVPIGVRGELQLAGPQLSDGYVGRDDLNRESFVEHALNGELTRWYRTGDEVRLNGDGELEFIGRLDHQVKINGYRIELGEIERVAQAVDDVTDVAAIVRKSASGAESITLYYSTESGKALDEKLVRSGALQKLPPYMIPAKIVWLDTMPFTPSGKVDRNSLPELENERPALVNAYVEPANELERKIARVWREELGLAEVGTLDNFFDLGGNSMIGLRVIEELTRTCSVDLTAAQFFQFPTVGGLGKFIAGASHVSGNESKQRDDARAEQQRLAVKRFKPRPQRGAT
ncbi:MAG: amino acid adenylation domain-containing protein [Woeseiaceae bacterium]|nr:amino acid adenylation domain-containing protein [Woeseiaceae bacterium]